MGMKIGSTSFTKLMCNSNEITKVYLGETEVYSSQIFRNIVVGDNLASKTVYMSFPTNLSDSISTTTDKFIITDSAFFFRTSKSTYAITECSNGPYGTEWQYAKNVSTGAILNNNMQTTLVSGFGTVTSINTSNPAYQYIKI